jgi:uncharacterized phiE125 gp8 family phage protein
VYGLTKIQTASSEPVSLQEMKDWLRLEDSFDDALINAIQKAARTVVERASGRQLVTTTWLMTLDTFPWQGGWWFLEAPAIFPDPHSIRMPKAPLQSVSSVVYTAMDGTQQTLASSRYNVDTRSDPGRIQLAFGQTWPVTRPKPGGIEITFVAGYGAAADVPDDLKTAIKMTAAWMYEHRGEDKDTNAMDIPAVVDSLIRLNWHGELEYGI